MQNCNIILRYDEKMAKSAGKIIFVALLSNAEKINLQLCQNHFSIDEAKNVGIAGTTARLFNEVYRKMVKTECRFIFVALLRSETVKPLKNGLPAFRSKSSLTSFAVGFPLQSGLFQLPHNISIT